MTRTRGSRGDKQAGHAGPGHAEDTSTLPYGKAFVVQFAAGTDPELRNVEGRIEHLRTGRRSRFTSIRGLLACIETMLAAADAAAEEAGGNPRRRTPGKSPRDVA